MFKKHKNPFYFKEDIIMTCYFQRGKVECFILFLNLSCCFFFIFVYDTHIHACTHVPSMQVPMEARRGHQTWSWSYSWLWASQCGDQTGVLCKSSNVPLTAEPSLHPLAFLLASKRCAVSLIFKEPGLPQLYLPTTFGDIEDNSVSFAFFPSPWPHPSPMQLPVAGKIFQRNLSTLSSQPSWCGGRAFSWPAWLGPLHNLCLYKWVCPASTFNWPIKPSQEQGIPAPRPIRRQRHPVISQLLASECQTHLLPPAAFASETSENTRPPCPLLDNNNEAMARSQRAVYTSLCQTPKKWL